MDAVKFQTYITEKRTKKFTNFNILKQCELSFDDFSKLNDYSKRVWNLCLHPLMKKVFFFKKLNTNKIKIASFDTVNTKFLKTS